MQNDLPPLMQEEKKSKQDILGNTKAEQAKWRKQNVGETEEKLDATGSANEKQGIKATQELYREYQKENFRIKSDRITWLNGKARFTKDRAVDYFRHVKTLVDYELSFLELPPGYRAWCEVTALGIKLILKDRFGGFSAGAFKPCGLGLYDEQACRTSVNKLDDAITFLENHPPSGVYLA